MERQSHKYVDLFGTFYPFVAHIRVEVALVWALLSNLDSVMVKNLILVQEKHLFYLISGFSGIFNLIFVKNCRQKRIMIFTKFKTPVLLLLVSFFIFGFSSKVIIVSCDDVLLRSRLALLNVKNINYNCNFMQKFAGGNDTLKTNANIILEKKSMDTLLGCNMKMTSNFKFYAIAFNTELFYNGKKNISMNHTKRKATIDTTGSRGKGKPTMNLLKQNFPTASMMDHYTEKLPYEPFFRNTSKTILLDDEKVGSYTCYKLQITIKEHPGNTSRTIFLFIDKQTFLPVRRIDLVDVNKKQQYSDFTLSSIKINDIRSVEQIKEPMIPKGYEIDFFRLDRY